MRSLYLFFVSVFFSLISSTAIGQNNFLLNGSFENSAVDNNGNINFERWQRGCNKPYNISLQSNLVHSGSYSVAYDADACLVQNLNTSSIAQLKGQSYELSCWINYGFSQGGEYGSLQFGFGDGGNVIREDVKIFPTGLAGAKPTWQKVTIKNIAPTQDLGWAYISIYENAYVLVDSCELSIDWGAKKLLNTDRPQSVWIDEFNNAAQVLVTTTIDNAISQCPADEYCELKVDQMMLNDTVYLNRSKTKITGPS